jgi:hypothetical protein
MKTAKAGSVEAACLLVEAGAHVNSGGWEEKFSWRTLKPDLTGEDFPRLASECPYRNI